MKALDSFSQRSLLLILLLPFSCHQVAANTEIINFWSSREPVVDLPVDVVGNWSTLHPTAHERRWSLEPAALHTPLHRVCESIDASEPESVSSSYPPFACPHELWLLLDLDDAEWASYAAFTLRLSWAASTPADFVITLYSPRDMLARLSEHGLVASTRASARNGPSPHTSSTPRTPTTRTKYARIRAVGAGVPTPTKRSHAHPPAQAPPLPRGPFSDADAPARQTEVTVPFVVILEPAYFGVLPASLLPTVGVLVPIVLAAAAVVPRVIAYLEPHARQARVGSQSGTTAASRGGKDR